MKRFIIQLICVYRELSRITSVDILNMYTKTYSPKGRRMVRMRGF